MNEKRKLQTNTLVVLSIITISLVSSIFFFVLPNSSSSKPIQFSLIGEGVFVEENSENLILRCYSPQVNIEMEFKEKRSINFSIKNAVDLILKIDNEHLILNREYTEYFGNLNVKNGTKLKINSDQYSDNNYNFSVISDTHNNPETVKEFLKDINNRNPSFVIHCGDIVPYGSEEHYKSWYRKLENLTVPIYYLPGNHDIQRDETSYLSHIGPFNHSFYWNNDLFILLDTADSSISIDQINWINGLTYTKNYNKLFIFMHVPPVDPRSNYDHAMIDSERAQELLNCIQEIQPNLVFNGHIHVFNETIRNNVTWITTGGGGGMLYASEKSGGYYHSINVISTDSTSTYEVIPIELSSTSFSLTLQSNDFTRQIGLSELLLLDSISGLSSFQNSFGNWRGFGNYTGITFANLIDLIGGIETNQIIRVTAKDGYYQDYCYENVFPNQTWKGIQGLMILSFKYNDTLIPNWDEGPRVAFLPNDSRYSNEDCLFTSDVNQGGNIYYSAGARWIRLVNKITIMENDY